MLVFVVFGRLPDEEDELVEVDVFAEVEELFVGEVVVELLFTGFVSWFAPVCTSRVCLVSVVKDFTKA